MLLNYPRVYGKIIFHKTSLCCQKGWGHRTRTQDFLLIKGELQGWDSLIAYLSVLLVAVSYSWQYV